MPVARTVARRGCAQSIGDGLPHLVNILYASLGVMSGRDSRRPERRLHEPGGSIEKGHRVWEEPIEKMSQKGREPYTRCLVTS